MSALDAYREAMSKQGCWVAYGEDHSYHYSTAVFPDELSARRHAMENYLTVAFLKWGESLETARARERGQ